MGSGQKVQNVGCDSENVAMQVKRRMRHPPSYRRSGVICKVPTDCLLERLLAEALAGQEAGRPGSPSSPLDQPAGPVELGFELRQRRLELLPGDALELQV